MNEDEILEYIYEIVTNPMLKCKSKIQEIEEILEEYFEEEWEDPDEDYGKRNKNKKNYFENKTFRKKEGIS